MGTVASFRWASVELQARQKTAARSTAVKTDYTPRHARVADGYTSIYPGWWRLDEPDCETPHTGAPGPRRPNLGPSPRPIGPAAAGVAPQASTMNPLLFADWGRMNRLFTRVMWAVAVLMVCAVCVALAVPAPKSHAASASPAAAQPAVPVVAPRASAGSIR